MHGHRFPNAGRNSAIGRLILAAVFCFAFLDCGGSNSRRLAGSRALAREPS